jgi:hypothetical protein
MLSPAARRSKNVEVTELWPWSPAPEAALHEQLAARHISYLA